MSISKVKILISLSIFSSLALMYSPVHGVSSVVVEIPAIEDTTAQKQKAATEETETETETAVAVAVAVAATNLTIPNSDDNFVSDRISFPVAIWVTATDLTLQGDPEEILCAPAGTQFRGLGERRIVTENNKPVVKTLFFVEKIGNDASNINRLKNVLGMNRYKAKEMNDDCAQLQRKTVKLHQAVLLTHERIRSFNPVRKGVTYGSLIVPYKYHRSGGGSFLGNTTLGGYLGYRVDRTGFTGFETNFIGFAGAASVAVPDEVADGDITVGNRTGVSYGLGILATVKNEFQLGLVLGQDKVDDSANYEHNGKTWIAFSLGFEFSN